MYVSMDELREAARRTPLRHSGLSEPQLAFAKYTYQVVGKYQCPTLEQWELGFMRDTHPDQELMTWMRISCVVKKLRKSQFRPREIAYWLAMASTLEGNIPGVILNAWRSISFVDCERSVRQALSDAGLQVEGGDNDTTAE